MKEPGRTWTLLAVGLMAACGGDSVGPEGDPPVLPDAESMVFDIETFPTGTPAAVAGPARTSHNTHHAVAAVTVGITNLVVAAHLIVPVATWRAARRQIPTLEEGRWHWRFEANALAATYSGDLAGFVEDGDAVFEMRISSSVGGLNNFLWYTGRAPIGGTTGEWLFYDPQDPPTAVGRVDWSHPGTAVWTLTFTALTGPNAGDTLTYDVDGTSRTMTYFDASASVTSEIQWDAIARDGYIEAPNYNGGARACWDGTLTNIACP